MMIRDDKSNHPDKTFHSLLQNGAIRGFEEANSGTRNGSQLVGGLIPRTDQLKMNENEVFSMMDRSTAISITNLVSFLFQIIHHALYI